jgi:PAS domain S-box-containing protein
MSMTRIERILEHAHNAVIAMDEAGRVTYWNPAAERTFGFGRDEAVGQPVAELIVPDRLREAHSSGLRRFLADGRGRILDRRVELAAVRRDGVEIPIEMTISALRDGEAWTFTAFVQDISERRRSERERERRLEELRRALTGTERRFDAIVGSLAEPVTIRDGQDQIVYANQAALTQLGFGSLEELRGTSPAEIMAAYVVHDEDGNEISMDQIPSVRLLRGEAPAPLLMRTIHRRTGVERWNLLKASPLLDAAGQVEATIMVIEDVTEQKRSERRSQFVAQAGEALASSLDYEQTLRNVAQLAVPDIVDWCAVDLAGGDGSRRPVAIAHVDPDRLSLARQLRSYEPERLDPNVGLGRVLRTGRAALYPEIDDEMLRASAHDERHLELLRAVGFRSAAVVPMRIGSRTLGAMTLVTAESGRVLDRADVEVAERVAQLAAVAIENARVYRERSRIAHTLQQSLLPDQLPAISGYEVAGVYVPAVEGAEVGGDFYDVWDIPSGCMVTIGDVTGKGVAAAALTSLIRHTLRATAEFVSSPAELLGHLDRMLKRQRPGAMCTALCLRLEGDQAILASGGHPPPVRITAHGTREVPVSGPLLGAFTDGEWRDTAIEFSPGDTLLVYTDGVTDAIGDGGERYGVRRLRTILSQGSRRSAPEVIEILTEALGRFQVGPQADDTAAVAVRRLSQDEVSAELAQEDEALAPAS